MQDNMSEEAYRAKVAQFKNDILEASRNLPAGLFDEAVKMSEEAYRSVLSQLSFFQRIKLRRIVRRARAGKLTVKEATEKVSKLFNLSAELISAKDGEARQDALSKLSSLVAS
jgi:Cdc6-like AAA superfamily ATPase